MKKQLITLALFALPFPAYAEIYKCEINGRTIYRDIPCYNGEVINPDEIITTYSASSPRPSPKISSSPSPSTSSRSAPRPTSEYQSATDRRNAMVSAHADGRLLPGMSENTAITILGVPDTSSTYTRSDGVECKQLYWRNPRFVSGSHRATICNREVVDYSKF